MSRSDSIYINPLTDRDKKAYKESLKVFMDNYAIAETEKNEGRVEGSCILHVTSKVKILATAGLF